MPIIYFIDLVLFQECIEFEKIKNDFTYKKFQKIKSFNFMIFR